jgi:uncharacterized protein (DUF1501 family)
MSYFNRRSFIATATSAAAVSFLPPFALAEARSSARFVLVILRGALDGLSAVPAYGDGNFERLRGELAITAPEYRLDGLFGLHPSFTHLYERYQARQLIAFHAIASPYRERSHFDGQDLLENGTTRPKTVHDGWLNRLLPGVAHGRNTEAYALALAQNVPLVLRGDSRVNSWAPSGLPETDSDTLHRIADLYSTDQYFASRLQAALSADSMAGEGGMNGGAKREPLNAMGPVASAAGRFLAAADGPRIAVIEVTGWDTHANQGAERGQLGNRLRSLDQGLEDLRTSLGSAWRDTAVMVVTEFGRTVAVNGTRGTDHGTATCAFLVGGAVAGGRVIADWPGLARSNLYQSRDLAPTLDLRSVFKGVLAAHLGASEKDLETRVFPDSRSAKLLDGLTRSA